MSDQEPSYAISVRVKHTHRSKYKNQRRHDLRVGLPPSYVQDERSELNRVLVDERQPSWPVPTTTLAGGAERKTGIPVWRAVPPA